MTFETNTPITKPIYNIGDIVYLRESASMGFIEAYTVKLPTYELDGTIYYVLVTGARAPDAISTVGDRITGRPTLPLRIPEIDLITACDAIDLATNNLELQLANLQTLRDASGCPEVTG